jgi:hypothetical protein
VELHGPTPNYTGVTLNTAFISWWALSLSGCTGNPPTHAGKALPTPSSSQSRAVSVTTLPSPFVPVRNVLVDYGIGRMIVPVPLAWSHRSGGYPNLSHVQVFAIFSTVTLPTPCRSIAPDSTECGVRLEVLRPGDAALVVRSGSNLSPYGSLHGVPATVGHHPALDLGTSPCYSHTCHSYALPLDSVRWLELSFALVPPQPNGNSEINAVLDGVTFTAA